MHSLLLLALSSCILVAFLFTPGYFCLSAFGISDRRAISLGPLVSVAALETISIIFAKINLAVTPLILGLLLFLAPLILWFALGKGRKNHFVKKRLVKDKVIGLWIYPALFIVGIFLSYYIFVKQVGDLSHITQNYDYYFHVNLIRDMANSYNLSPLNVSFYRGAIGFAAPFDLGTFYPAVYHAYMAVLVMFLHISAPAAITLGTAAIAAVIFPFGIYVFTKELLGPEPQELLHFNVGVLIFSLAGTAFPWMLIFFGPLYPNVFGYSLLPYFLLFVVVVLRKVKRLKDIVRALPLLFVGLMSLAFAHPNTIFAAYAMLMPYVCYMIYHKTDGTWRKKCATSFGFLVLYGLVWLACFKTPMLHDTVWHSWQTYSYPVQALITVFSLNYSYAFCNMDAAPWVLIPFVVIGIYVLAKSKSRRWLCVSYAFVAFIFMYNISYYGRLRQLLGGFWYTDPVRIAAMLSIMATVFAIVGYMKAMEMLLKLSRALPGQQKISKKAATFVSALVLMFLAFVPNFNWPGLPNPQVSVQTSDNKQVTRADYNVKTAMGSLRDNLEQIYTWQMPLSDSERHFLDEIAPIVGSELIINNPIDGSFLAYGTNNLNLYYRTFQGAGSPTETEDSKNIRLKLYQLGQNGDVAESLKHVGAKYVLLLDKSDSISSFINLRGDYIPDDFYGIYSITSTTPHLKLIKQDKACYLYEIEL